MIGGEYCEWCGAHVIANANAKGAFEQSQEGLRLAAFCDLLTQIDNEIINGELNTGTWGVLDGAFSKAFSNPKIDGLKQRKINAINSFGLPNEIGQLVELSNLALVNIDGIKVTRIALTENARTSNKINKALRKAWFNKLERILSIMAKAPNNNDYLFEQIQRMKFALANNNK